MRIVIKKANRKSIAYSLEPDELAILIPNDAITNPKLERVLSITNGNFMNKEAITREEFSQLLDKWKEELQVNPSKIQLKRMKSKWASCSPGKSVFFNSSLINMPKEFVGYVVCHELLHFKVPNHNRLFRNLLSAYMPDWRERIERTINWILSQNNGNKLEQVC